MAARGRTRSESLAFDFADIRTRLHVIVGVAKGVAKGFYKADLFSAVPFQRVQVCSQEFRKSCFTMLSVYASSLLFASIQNIC